MKYLVGQHDALRSDSRCNKAAIGLHVGIPSVAKPEVREMIANGGTKLTLTELLNAANRHYSEGFIAEYFDPVTGMPKAEASGDSVAGFIVNEISELFAEEYSREGQIAVAVGALERAQHHIQSAIEGLKELKEFTISTKSYQIIAE